MTLQGEKQLIAAGFTEVKPLGTRRILLKWDGMGEPHADIKGPVERGHWFEAHHPQHGTVLILRQARSIWHAFGAGAWTASHSDAARVCDGGLGDAISTDGELKSYSRYVRRAPEAWCDKFVGLLEAKRQV